MLEQLQTNLNNIDEGVFNPHKKYIRYPPTGANGLRKRYAGDGTTLRPRDYVEVDETDQPASRDERTIDEYRFLHIGEKGRWDDDEMRYVPVPTLCRLERRRWDDDDECWVEVDEADRWLGLNRWVTVGPHMPQDDEVLSVARARVAAAEAEVAKRRGRVAAAQEEAEQVTSTMRAAVAYEAFPVTAEQDAEEARWDELRNMEARDEEEEAEFKDLCEEGRNSTRPTAGYIWSRVGNTLYRFRQ